LISVVWIVVLLKQQNVANVPLTTASRMSPS